MLVPHRCQMSCTPACWFVVTDQLKDSCFDHKGGVEMLFFVWQAGAFALNDSRAHLHVTLWCPAFTRSSWLSLPELFNQMKSLPSAELLCSSFHPTYSSPPPFMPVDLRSLVIYSCHSRESATLVMLLPHFSNSVCAQPDFTLFLPPRALFLCLNSSCFLCFVKSSNGCSAKIYFF